MGLGARIRITLEMIKWEHSIFALPFALTAAILAARGMPSSFHGLPSLPTLAWILVAMVTARSAAMAFNRWADAGLDAANPRTKSRAIPAGQLSAGFVLAFTVVMVAVFLIACSQLNRLTLELSPIVLVVLLGYSYLKRITRFSHIGLGLALGLAPCAAWVAVRGSLDWRIALLTVIVTCWAAGFDVLYACQDMEHDRQAGLNSIPQAMGLNAAFWVARALHFVVIALLPWFVTFFHLGPIALAGMLFVAILLLYEHLIVSPRDLSRLNAAFFTMNGVIAMVFFASVAADIWLGPLFFHQS
jgi:4-hydroxybenzoate polyprenyltransferase